MLEFKGGVRDRKEMPQVLFVFPSEKEGGRGLRPLKTLNLRKNLRKIGGRGGDNLRKTVPHTQKSEGGPTCGQIDLPTTRVV